MKTIAELCNQFEEFCLKNNFPFISADELLSEETIKKTEEQRIYLKNFLINWDNATEFELNNPLN